MEKRNAAAQAKGSGAECLLAGDIGVYNINVNLEQRCQREAPILALHWFRPGELLAVAP